MSVFLPVSQFVSAKYFMEGATYKLRKKIIYLFVLLKTKLEISIHIRSETARQGLKSVLTTAATVQQEVSYLCIGRINHN
jgi:hypothetical protein